MSKLEARSAFDRLKENDLSVWERDLLEARVMEFIAEQNMRGI